MRARLAILLAAAACAAGADDFTLDGGIVATTSPDGGVTFRAGDATLSFAPFECAPSESGEKPVLTFRADGDALVAEVAGDPAAFGRVSFGCCSAMPKELYFGYGYCVRDPERLHVPLNGHHNATRFAGFTFANGLSLVLATTTAPDALFVDLEKGAFGFACSQPTRFTFVPGRAGAFDCALRARRHFAEKAPRGFAAKAGRFCVDTWNGAFAQHERLIRRCAEYGLRDDLLFYVHCWQRYGFDRHLPDVYPPSPTFGTAAELKRACATAHAHGWSFGVHLNVIDCYTNSPWFDWSKISHDAKGRPIKAWINPPYQERSYRLLPEFAPASISYQVESLLADGFCPDTVFVDVTGSGAMSSGTCRDAAGRVHPLISNTAANGRMFDTARALLEGAGKRPAFVSSEAPCDYLAGYMDGGDCQWMFLSHEKDVYRWMTVGGTGLVTKVPWMPLVWHDRLSLHGAGYSARFEGARGEDCHGIDSDDYISCEIMNGHSLMADCYNRDAYKAEAGILDAIDEPRCLRQIVRKYWLAQHVIREIGAASVQSVSFPDGDPRHVKVVWSTSLTVFVNRDVCDWTVATDDACVGEVTLPQYGFVAFNPKTGNYVSIRRRGRRVVEESAYRDGTKTVRYVNPRGADTARNRLPLAPATTVCRSDDHFSATVNWKPFGGRSVPKGKFRVSLWLLDPMFREYSPKDAALRVATADVTLDQPTSFSFAWPKGVKGPRVVHVAVAPAGADADNPDARFKLLGTSAFYRRYRQGALTAKGTWTPYRCPDENLWERLFPPSEPVDYGWIKTAEAFRLITEPGKPDVKTLLPLIP
ncbi:MAG: hypothetical protein IJL17_01255 [Kiritimatiellae bacterium]|nr:hypothetical protein [Kiritimatiellia bacterium]